jgi:shikimate kinase
MKIILLGYMGCGKTTIGSQLAKKLYQNFTDLDDYIEKKENKTISEIFTEKGEIYFRNIEHNYLKKFINENDSYVLSLGGGTPCYANNINIISQEADVYSIYLQGSVTTLYERLKINSSKRPLIASLKKDSLIEYIAKHLFERSVYYEKAKHRISINSKGVDDIVAEIRILLH